MRCFRVWMGIAVAIAFAVGAAPPTTTAAAPPDYFVDESKLPFR